VRQFGFRSGKARRAAIQANQNLGKYQNTGIINILEAKEMDVYLSSEFRLVA
jgi:hypothetical protein